MIGRTISHYEIVEKLGEGGMGVVYKARDSHLDRFVALKVLPPEKVSDAERKRRFVREAKAASALNHPNIITVYDIDQDCGTAFIAMECVAGQTLGQLIAQGLSMKEVVKYAVQIADALAATHAIGIVHRDLKPANVMVTETGLVKVLDFGLAKLTEAAIGPEDATRTERQFTELGAVVGTAAYMSPEQAEGRLVDARSDLFSFGTVLYEMLSRRRAFAGLSHMVVLAAVLHDEPAPLGGDVPFRLEQVVKRCLRKKPEERYRSAGELKQALEEAALAPAPLSSIAVLPFANLSAEKENEYFSDGLAEDIIDGLAKVPGLRVIARTSAFAFRDKDVSVREIGTTLDVGHVLEGSLRKAGSRIRVTAQLIRTSDQSHLWSERYDREMTDVFAIQDDISHAIVEKLRVQLAPGRPLLKRPTGNLEAYNLFLKGRHCIFRATPEWLAKGKEYVERAIALDPGYVVAYIGLAHYYGISSATGFVASSETLPRIRSAVLMALKLDNTLAEAHAMLGMVRGTGDFDWDGAEREFQRGLELDPASPLCHYLYGIGCLTPLGRLEDGRSEVLRALELDPLSTLYNPMLGMLYGIAGQHERGIAQLQRALELDSSAYVPRIGLAVVYGRMGRREEAIAAAEKACELSGRSPATLGALAQAYGQAGRQDDARALLEELTTKRDSTYVPPLALAMAHAGLRDLDHMLEWLEKAVEERDINVIMNLKSGVAFGPIRQHSRFKALLRMTNLDRE